MGNESQRRADLEEGIEKAREAERDLHKHPFSRPVTDAFGMYGFDQMGLGEDGKRAYEDLRGGKSISEIRQEFEDSLGEESKSSRKGVVSSGGYCGRRSSDREWDKTYDHDRHYHGYVYDQTWDEMNIPGKICHVAATAIFWGLAAVFYGIILVPLSLGIWYGASSGINNIRIQPKVKVAREHKLPVSSLVDKVKWDVSSFERLFSSRGPRDNNQENAVDFLKFRMKNDRLSNELKENLDGLARIILDNRGRWVRFRSYFQKGDNVWVAGRYSNKGGGFICYSPDKGDTWFKQWSSYPRERGGCTYDIPGAIHFFDQNEGWSFTMRRILHTLDGGRNWKTAYASKNGYVLQFHILNKNTLVAQEKVVVSEEDRIRNGINGRPLEVPQLWMMSAWVRNQKKVPYKRTVYTTDGGKEWQTIEEWRPEIFELDKLSRYSKTRGFYIYNK